MQVYINSSEAISPQNTFGTNNFFTTPIEPQGKYFTCCEPNYKQYIDSKLLRRMSRVVKMGIATSNLALKNAQVAVPDAIIIGSGLGCIDDTTKFLAQIIENDETLLNPTAFIQSTHNTVSGQIALLLGCSNYNFTFTQQQVSFETALLDAVMMLNEKPDTNLLMGGLDEINNQVFELLEQKGCAKAFHDVGLVEKNNAYIPGEGSGFFVLSNQLSEKNIARITGLELFQQMNTYEEAEKFLKHFLALKNLDIQNIDILISGTNSLSDNNYKIIHDNLVNSVHLTYKNMVGEFDTASAFAMWLGVQIIKNQQIPEGYQINKVAKKTYQTILIHNFNTNHNHSFILLEKC